MKVLVSAASKHGATAEIAETIGAALASDGLEVDVRRPEDVTTTAPYNAVVLGSGVYAGRWLASAREFSERAAESLKARPVWLFSSGPVGDPAKPAADPVDVEAIRKRTNAIDHRVFAGKLDRQKLGFGERAIVLAVHAAEGDFRSWDDVAAWAAGIAVTLKESPTPVAEPVA